jgi:hypothetical protein
MADNIWTATVEGIAARGRANNGAEGDYRDEEGFLCCGKCRTRKEGDITIGEKTLRVPHLCKCESEASRQREAEEKAAHESGDDMRIAAATALRDAGVRTQLYCEQKKFKAKMSYADKLGIPYVILIGEDEIAENVVAVKNMTTGEQTKLGFADAASLIKKDMDDRARVAVIKE